MNKIETLINKEKEQKNFTLVFVIKEEKILLGYKKRGFGKDYYNGFGGKVEKDETIEEAAYRELEEEAGIKTDKIEKIAQIFFEFEKEENRTLIVHVFITNEYSGEIIESDEMKPQWFNISDIPYSQMWPGIQFFNS
jgi:8-oxo-dGTP pyrophosphatase MutT (NUDIX family)